MHKICNALNQDALHVLTSWNVINLSAWCGILIGVVHINCQKYQSHVVSWVCVRNYHI